MNLRRMISRPGAQCVRRRHIVHDCPIAAGRGRSTGVRWLAGSLAAGSPRFEFVPAGWFDSAGSMIIVA